MLRGLTPVRTQNTVSSGVSRSRSRAGEVFSDQLARQISAGSTGTPRQPAVGSTEFTPKFREAFVTGLWGITVPLNPAYFATLETAQWIAQKYGTGEVVEVPFLADGSPFRVNIPQYYVRLRSGEMVNAGLLADYYRALPESQNPGVADRMIRDLLAREWHV